MLVAHAASRSLLPPRLTQSFQILNYLRDTADSIDVQFSQGPADLQALIREAQYYRLSDLKQRIAEVTSNGLFVDFARA